MIKSTTRKYCSVAFIWIVTLKDFIHRLKSWIHFAVINSTTRKYCSVAFMCILALEADSSQQTQNLIRSTLIYETAIHRWLTNDIHLIGSSFHETHLQQPNKQLEITGRCHLAQDNHEQYRRKVSLSSFPLTVHVLGFYSETPKLESPCTE